MATDSPVMFPRLVVRSLANSARITAWTLVTLATCAALVTLFATASMEVGRRLTSTLRLSGANAVAWPVTQDKDTPREDDVARWGSSRQSCAGRAAASSGCRFRWG